MVEEVGSNVEREMWCSFLVRKIEHAHMHGFSGREMVKTHQFFLTWTKPAGLTDHSPVQYLLNNRVVMNRSNLS